MPALICTVGTTINAESDIVDALVGEIKSVAPEYVVFIVSVESRENAERVASGAGLPAHLVEFVVLSTPHNLNEVFEKTNEVIRNLKTRGYDSSLVSVNYTSGTKVMGSGAVLSAVFHQCGELRYIYEAGDNRNQLVTTHPRAVGAFRDLRLACRLVEEMRFSSARDLVNRIDVSLLSSHDIEVVQALRSIAAAYHHWDNFRHGEVMPLLKSVSVQDEALKKFRIADDSASILDSIAADLEQGNYSPAVLADMLNNARRRRREGKLDDAVARSYRVLEMLGQWVLLQRYEIDTNDLDTRRVPPRHRVGYEAMRSMEDGQVRIGMRKTYELLDLLDAPLGKRFEDNTVLHELLQCRGRSILAHGTHSFKEEDCDSLLGVTRELLVSEITDIDQLCRSLQFPWLNAAEFTPFASE